ncbi:MAG: DRTGG domain-containing protein [Oscillospiraceae bacterium]|nr:DRTGG domain-containing protein [Oscillospiraceae bacterium]
MKISEIKSLLDADVLSCEDRMDTEVCSACGSDMMSDVLAYVKDQALLLTGLVNEQVVRTAAMMDMKCVVLVRRKAPTPEMIELAAENGIVMMKTQLRMFEACGILYAAGLCGKASEHV